MRIADIPGIFESFLVDSFRGFDRITQFCERVMVKVVTSDFARRKPLPAPPPRPVLLFTEIEAPSDDGAKAIENFARILASTGITVGDPSPPPYPEFFINH